jgi:hypothetical protein
MLPEFLLTETTIRESGVGRELHLGDGQRGTLVITLGITGTIEQQGIDVAIFGSPDGRNWNELPLVSFPQKFYCGTYQIVLDLWDHQEVKFLRPKWVVSRWGPKYDRKPLFNIYLVVEEVLTSSSVPQPIGETYTEPAAVIFSSELSAGQVGVALEVLADLFRSCGGAGFHVKLDSVLVEEARVLSHGA